MTDRDDLRPVGSREQRALDAVVAEAKEHLVPRVPGDALRSMEDRLMARIAAEPSPLARDRAASPRRRWATAAGALALAAAAALAVVTKKDVTPLVESAPTVAVEGAAGSLRATEGAGVVRIAGTPALPGHALRAGDLVEADGARAVLERPRRVAWLLERGGARDAAVTNAAARARVKAAGESLVVGLEEGAIEAQVTPVPSGEAFAVDVATDKSLVRVAVHGTHFRVSRAGSRVVVDLSEGVVSIGAPPRTGSTYGTLVTAPAHVELDADDLDGSLRIDHAPSSVRSPMALSPHDPATVAERDPALADVPATRGVTGAKSPEPAAPSTRPAAVPRPADLPATPPKQDTSKPAIAPREAIAKAVRECAAARLRSGSVRVTVTSSLRLRIGAGGVVESAQFDPPLVPEVQTCAAHAIYKARLDDAGPSVTIPIEFSY